MPRRVVGGLIQAAAPITDPAAPIDKVRQAAIDAHIPLIEEAGRRGVQILGLEEIFNGPYFCPSQDAHWYDIAESVPGPTTELMGQYARKYQMAMVVPVYEREQAGVYYNTAAVYDSDGTYLGKYRKNHIPHTSGFWEKYFFKPGNLGYPVFKTRFATIGVYICYDRHFPEGARLLGLHGAEIVFNPSATVAGLSQYSVEARTAGARGRQRLLHGLQQPRRHGVALEHRTVLWLVLLCRSARQLPRDGIRRQGRTGRGRDGSRHDRGSASRLAVLPRSPPRQLRTPRGAASMTLLIKNGTIVTATDQYKGDVFVDGEKITTIGTSLTMSADRTIDASGKYLFPGGIDVHTHLDMPFGGTTSADDFESGTIAAAHGGTTTVVDFAIQYHGQTLHHAWETWMKKAEGKAAIDYGFHMIVTELTDQVEQEMDALVGQGVTSFKLFMAYPGVFMLDDASIFRALLRTGKNGGTICMHAENGGVIDVLVKKALAEGKTAPKYHALTRPARAEAEATHRAIAMAEIADVPIYIVHLSAAEALEMVTEARDRGLPAFAETCPQYLFLSYDNYEEPGFEGAKYVMSPPLRPKETQDRLWRGLAFNDLQAISTDHCPFCMKEQKTMGERDFSKIPNGAPGIETRMSLVYDGGVKTGRISLNRFVELTSTSPAKIFGLFPRKGTIAPGSDADIVIFDPEKKQRLSAKTLHMNVDYNPYEGREVTGVTETVISRGRVIIDKGSFTGSAGAGSFLRRSTRT